MINQTNNLASLIKDFLGEQEFNKVLSQPISRNLKTNSLPFTNIQNNETTRPIEKMIIDSSTLNEEDFEGSFLNGFYDLKTKQQEQQEQQKQQAQEEKLSKNPKIEKEETKTQNRSQLIDKKDQQEIILDFLMEPLSIGDPMNRENPCMGVVFYNHLKNVIKTSQKNGSLVSKYRLNDETDQSLVRRGNCSRDLAEWILSRNFFNPKFQKQKRKRGRKTIDRDSQEFSCNKKNNLKKKNKKGATTLVFKKKTGTIRRTIQTKKYHCKKSKK
ncbi:hypothetical protein M0813_22285 [Anaeramoeba flamelloides]|uniref:Uncharacterized protein n=1 Tax=Anaeramoeba flamelloides TaxID=1746091 RepID=A0ABQ8YFL1_9EUKA|nr:hypothetical protein M0813_22285 [Anaeramoeba flamelloides]